MRSYALQGYQNQGTGETFPNASWILLIKAIYLDWIFHGGRWGSLEKGVNSNALVFSGFVCGMMILGCVTLIVSFCTKDHSAAEQMQQKKSN